MSFQYFKERSEAVQALKESGWQYPHEFEITHTLKQFHSCFDDLRPGEQKENTIVSLAGMLCMHIYKHTRA